MTPTIRVITVENVRVIQAVQQNTSVIVEIGLKGQTVKVSFYVLGFTQFYFLQLRFTSTLKALSKK